MLLDDTVASCEIEEPFLQQFADVSEPHWDLLAPYITPLESSPREASRHTVLGHLQNWKRKMHPMYGDLADILSHLFIDPPAEEETTLGDSNGNISLYNKLDTLYAYIAELHTGYLLISFPQIPSPATTRVPSPCLVSVQLQFTLRRWTLLGK